LTAIVDVPKGRGNRLFFSLAVFLPLLQLVKALIHYASYYNRRVTAEPGRPMRARKFNLDSIPGRVAAESNNHSDIACRFVISRGCSVGKLEHWILNRRTFAQRSSKLENFDFTHAYPRQIRFVVSTSSCEIQCFYFGSRKIGLSRRLVAIQANFMLPSTRLPMRAQRREAFNCV